MDQGLAKILGARLAAGMPQGNGVSCPVVLDHASVIDRKIGSLLLEIRDRVSSRSHHFTEKPVGLAHRPVWIVHKSCLHHPPLLEVTLSGSSIQRVNVIFPDPLLDFFKPRFGTRASGFAYGAFVFGPEAFAKPPGLLCSQVENGDGQNGEDRNDNRDNLILRHVE